MKDQKKKIKPSEELGARIRELRRDRGMEQMDLSRAAYGPGYDINICGNWEAATTLITESEIQAITKAMNAVKPLKEDWWMPWADHIKPDGKRVDRYTAQALGKRLTVLREGLGLTKKDVALAIGALPSTYLRIEKGEGVPTLPQLTALVKLLKTSYSYLIDGVPDIQESKVQMKEEINRQAEEIAQLKAQIAIMVKLGLQHPGDEGKQKSDFAMAS